MGGWLEGNLLFVSHQELDKGLVSHPITKNLVHLAQIL